MNDPKVFGPGMWICIHTLALQATTEEKKKEYANEIRAIINGIKCEECHSHATKYLKENPVEKYFKIRDSKLGAEIGCFKWSWVFHNAVNKRLGKKQIDFNTALMMYVGSDEKCTDCGATKKKEETEEDKTQVITIKSKVIR